MLGGLAICVGICVLIWMPDSPMNARMLTHEEKIAAIERVRDDQGGIENRTLKKEQVIETLLDVRAWLIVLTHFLSMYCEHDRCCSWYWWFDLASIPNGGLSNCKSDNILQNCSYHSSDTSNNSVSNIIVEVWTPNLFKVYGAHWVLPQSFGYT